MTELDLEFVFGCAILAACVSLMLYLILDYQQMCRASRFELPTPSPLQQRRPRTTMPTPLYGERR